MVSRPKRRRKPGRAVRLKISSGHGVRSHWKCRYTWAVSIWLNDEDQESHLPPRASRVVLPAGFETAAELWIGGAHTAFGEDLGLETMRGAWLVDCANEFPSRFREAAGLSLYRVFTDTEESPPNWPRIDALARSLAACLRGSRRSWSRGTTRTRRQRAFMSSASRD